VRTLLFFIYAIRLVGAHTHQAPANFNNATSDAQYYFKQYFDNSVQLYGVKFAKYTNHCLIHLVDDVRTYNSSLGGLSAYKYESLFQYLFKWVSIIVIFVLWVYFLMKMSDLFIYFFSSLYVPVTMFCLSFETELLSSENTHRKHHQAVL
jgi:hypothetical protein